jgi:hypothetical protein
MREFGNLVRDWLSDPLAEARSRARQGQRVIAFTQPDVPVELLMAAGAFPLALPVNAASTPRALELLESGFSAASRAVAEQWLTGKLDFVDTVVLSRGDDSFQRLYYYMCELRRCGQLKGPKPVLFDLAKIPRHTSLLHTAAALRILADDISADARRCQEAILVRNRRRALLDRLHDARASAVPPAGELCEQILRSADTQDAEAFDEKFADWLNEARANWTGPRVLLTGSRLTDDELHRAVAEGGGRVVGEHSHHLSSMSNQPPPSAADPMESLARYYHDLSYGPRHFADRGALLDAQVKRLRPSAAIVWASEEDESVAWQLPHLVKTLQDLSIPTLKLARQRAASEGARLARRFVEELGT